MRRFIPPSVQRLVIFTWGIYWLRQKTPLGVRKVNLPMRSQGGVKFGRSTLKQLNRTIENDHRLETEDLRILGFGQLSVMHIIATRQCKKNRWGEIALEIANLQPSSVHHKASHIRSVAALKR